MAGLPEDVQASLAASVPFPARLGQATEYAALVSHIIDNAMLTARPSARRRAPHGTALVVETV